MQIMTSEGINHFNGNKSDSYCSIYASTPGINQADLVLSITQAS